MFRPSFVMEKLGDTAGTMDVLSFNQGNAKNFDVLAKGVPFSELPKMRADYEKQLGLPSFSEFKPSSI